MQRRMLLFAVPLICAAFAAPAQANFTVGIGEQSGRVFSDANFKKTGIKKVRYLVPYDWDKHAGQKAEVDGFMKLSQAAGSDVLVHFTARRGCYKNGRYSRRRACRAPSVSKYKSAVKRFLKTYPWVKTIGVWNEENHVSQPTHDNPALAARYFLAARSVCKGCKIVAADVLDQRSMVSWVQRFQKKAQGKARIFGLHNYVDVNRHRTSGTRDLLRVAKGEVWLTETGGILTFLPSFKKNEKRQAGATKYMFALAAKYQVRRSGLRSKVTRLYNYQWFGASKRARFDAGLVGPTGKPRKAFTQFKKLAKIRKK